MGGNTTRTTATGPGYVASGTGGPTGDHLADPLHESELAAQGSYDHLRPAEAVFQEAKASGQSTTSAFLETMVKEPLDTAKIFGEEFVKDELKSFVGGMDLANTVAGLSPSKEVQTITTFVTQPMANLVDIYAGVVVGDEDRVKDALQDTLVETVSDVAMGAATDKLGIKTVDGRVSPTVINSSGRISDAAFDTTLTNTALSAAKNKFLDVIGLGDDD